jgi:hypothetical protein
MFYWCINVGSFAAIATIPVVMKYFGPRVAFVIPGIFMAAALFVFWSGRRLYVLVEPSKGADRPAGFARVLRHCLQHSVERPPGEVSAPPPPAFLPSPPAKHSHKFVAHPMWKGT